MDLPYSNPTPGNIIYPKDHGLTAAKIEFLKRIYYTDGNLFGVVKLFDIIRNIYSNEQAIYKIYRIQLQRWLYGQRTHQLNLQRPKQRGNKPFRINTVRTAIQCDLINLISNTYQDYKYLLVCIDLFSKYVFLYPIKNKESNTVAPLIVNLIVTNNYKILSTDNGGEFTFVTHPLPGTVTHIFGKPYAPTSQSNVERLNGTLRLGLQRFFNQGGKNWPIFVQKFINGYNNSKTKTLKTTPNKVMFSNTPEENSTLAANRISTTQLDTPAYGRDQVLEIGTIVRLINLKKIKSKNQKLNNYLNPIYKIIKRLPNTTYARNRYLLEDINTRIINPNYFNTSNLQVIQTSENPPNLILDSI